MCWDYPLPIFPIVHGAFQVTCGKDSQRMLLHSGWRDLQRCRVAGVAMLPSPGLSLQPKWIHIFPVVGMNMPHFVDVYRRDLDCMGGQWPLMKMR